MRRKPMTPHRDRIDVARISRCTNATSEEIPCNVRGDGRQPDEIIFNTLKTIY